MHPDEGPSIRMQTISEITPATEIDANEAPVVVEISQEGEAASQMSLRKCKRFVRTLLF